MNKPLPVVWALRKTKECVFMGICIKKGMKAIGGNGS
jgi:hypothetical protein